MGKTYMGFEGVAYYGVAGSTASTLIENATDISFNNENEEGSTAKRGDSSAPPINTVRVTGRSPQIQITMLNKAGDSVLEALRAAAMAGTPVAIRLKDHTSGKGPDGDCTVSVQHGKPLKGEQTLQFTFKPNDDLRPFSPYV